MKKPDAHSANSPNPPWLQRTLAKGQWALAEKAHLPMLSKLIPTSPEGWVFLLASGMLGRFLVGNARIAADAPALNDRDDMSPQQKTDTFLERIFLESIGVVGNFLAIQLGQDVFANAYEAIEKRSHKACTMQPAQLLNNPALKQDPHYANIVRSLAYTFSPHYLNAKYGNQAPSVQWAQLQQAPLAQLEKDLGQVQHVMAKTLYQGAKIHRFNEALHTLSHSTQPLDTFSLEQVLKPESTKALNHYFASNNIKTNMVAITGGLVLGTLFSGVAMQLLNDGVVRQSIVPRLSHKLTPLLLPNEDPLATASPRHSPKTSLNLLSEAPQTPKGPKQPVAKPPLPSTHRALLEAPEHQNLWQARIHPHQNSSPTTL
jgi:hypothetical protein